MEFQHQQSVVRYNSGTSDVRGRRSAWPDTVTIDGRSFRFYELITFAAASYRDQQFREVFIIVVSNSDISRAGIPISTQVVAGKGQGQLRAVKPVHLSDKNRTNSAVFSFLMRNYIYSPDQRRTEKAEHGSIWALHPGQSYTALTLSNCMQFQLKYELADFSSHQ